MNVGPLDELERDEQVPLDIAGVVDGDDVFVLELRGGLLFDCCLLPVRVVLVFIAFPDGIIARNGGTWWIRSFSWRFQRNWIRI